MANTSKNFERRPREFLYEHEVETLIKTAKKYSRNPTRDALMILMAYKHGLRALELTGLRWSCIDFENYRITIQRGKNSLSGVHPLFEKECRELRKLKREYEQKGGVFARSPYVFNSEQGSKLQPKSFHYTIVRLGIKAGLLIQNIHPHMLRHACGYALFNDRRKDIREIQIFLGHKEIKNTAIYAAMDMSRLETIWD